MKYYLIFLHNEQNQYCGHTYIALPPDKSLSDYYDEYDKVHSITENEYYSSQPLYRV